MDLNEFLRPDWSWGDHDSQFPDREIESWEFYAPPSDEDGSDLLQARIPREWHNKIEELVFDAKRYGIPLRYTSDFVRWAVLRGMLTMIRQYGITNDYLESWATSTIHALQYAEMLNRNKEAESASRQVVQGLEVLYRRNNYKFCMKQIEGYLKPILAMYGAQYGDATETYIEALFSKSLFKRILEDCEKAVGESAIVNNAKLIYERISQSENQSDNQAK